MTEIRCVKCRRLLMKVEDNKGTIEIKCPKCGHINRIMTSPSTKNMTWRDYDL